MIKFLEQINNEFKDIKALDMSLLENKKEITKDNTTIVVVDMVKGFYNEGPLQNEKVKEIINPMINFLTKVKDYNKIFFIDSHEEKSVEFSSYPAHCICGTSESDIIDELVNFAQDKNSILIRKNSINGFHSTKFQEWINNNEDIKNYIIVGVCTDICVKTLAISLKTYFNEINQYKKIIVPKNMVETYDAPFHNREFNNLISFYEMKNNGIEVVKEIICD